MPGPGWRVGVALCDLFCLDEAAGHLPSGPHPQGECSIFSFPECLETFCRGWDGGRKLQNNITGKTQHLVSQGPLPLVG